MEVYLQRGELRRLMRNHLQQADDDVLATQNTSQYNALLNTAMLKVFQDCKWYASNRRQTVDVGIGQYKVGYPQDTAPGSITEAAIQGVGDDDLGSGYTKMRRAMIPVQYDTDQEEAAGGDTFTAVQDQPEIFEPRGDFIYLYPPADRAYKLRLDYQVRKQFGDDEDATACDGQLVLYWALALATITDPEQRSIWQGMYADRVGQLKANQSTNQAVPLSREADFDESNELAGGAPNWDRRPTTRP